MSEFALAGRSHWRRVVRGPNPFAQPGRWFKGCLHVHSTASDGALAPDEVMDWYQSRGYHFLALTDHRVFSPAQSVNDGFITLSGIEMDGVDPTAGMFHLVGLGLHSAPDLDLQSNLSMQEAVDRLRAAGGRVMLAHPYWSGQRSGDLLTLDGCFGLEVYNGGCEVDDARGHSAVHWDDLLAAGRRLWGLAVDDAHWRNGCHDAGLGWIWVKAADLTQQSILDAVEQGLFYASSGPQIHHLASSEGQVTVRCSPSVHIDFVGNGHYSRRVSAPAGETIAEATHRPHPWQSYLRVACRDGQGGCAWANPLFLDEEVV